MSRNEGREEEQLSAVTVFFIEKAYFFSRTTLMREGMSDYEDRVIENTLQRDDTRIAECVTASNSSE